MGNVVWLRAREPRRKLITVKCQRIDFAASRRALPLRPVLGTHPIFSGANLVAMMASWSWG